MTDVKEKLQHTLGGFIVHRYFICNNKSKTNLPRNSLPTSQKTYLAPIKLPIILCFWVVLCYNCTKIVSTQYQGFFYLWFFPHFLTPHFNLFLPFIHLYLIPYFFLSYFSHAPASYTEPSFPFSFFSCSFYFTPASFLGLWITEPYTQPPKCLEYSCAKCASYLSENCRL